MFNKYKQFKDMKKQAKDLQNELGTVTSDGSAMFGKVKMIVNGNREIVNVVLEEGAMENREKLQEAIKDAYKDATGTKFQLKLAKKMQEMGGLEAFKNMM